MDDPSEISVELRRKFAVPALLAFVVLLALLLYGDLSKMGPTLAEFHWPLLPLILTLTLLDDFLRFIKWDYLLKVIGVHLPRGESAAVFFGGLVMAITPGKVGEVFKSLLVKRLSGERMSNTMPVVMVERFTDLMAVTLLAAVGAIYFQHGLVALAVVGGLAVAFILVIQSRSLSLWLIEKMSLVPLIGKYSDSLLNFYESSYQLLRLPRLLLTTGISILSWGSECFALYLVFQGLGVGRGFLLSTFIFTFSSLVGAVSMLPGGLGVAEGSMAGTMVGLANFGRPSAVSATLLIRISTLWFAVLIGSVTLFCNRKKFRLKEFLKEG